MGSSTAVAQLVRWVTALTALTVAAACSVGPGGQTPSRSPAPPSVQGSPSAAASPTQRVCSARVEHDPVGHGGWFYGDGFAPDVPISMTFANDDGSTTFTEAELPALRSDVRGAFRLHLYSERKDIGTNMLTFAGGGCEVSTVFELPAEVFPAAECDVLDAPAASGGEPADAYASAIAADEPFSYWRFEEETGNPTDTVSGDEASLRGSPILAQPGVVGGSRSVLLNKDGDYVDIPDIVLEADFTIEAWYRFCGNWIWWQDAIVGQAGPGASINFFEWRPRLYDGESDVVISSELLGREGWHHLAVTRAADEVVMYQDGVNVGTGELTTPYPIKAIGAGELNEWDEVFGGWLDEIAFYDHALSAERIAQHAALGND